MEIKLEEIKSQSANMGEEMFIVTFSSVLDKNGVKDILKATNKHKIDVFVNIDGK